MQLEEKLQDQSSRPLKCGDHIGSPPSTVNMIIALGACINVKQKLGKTACESCVHLKVCPNH